MRCFSRSSVVTSGFASSGRRLIGSKKDISVIVVDDIPSVGSKGEIKQGETSARREERMLEMFFVLNFFFFSFFFFFWFSLAVRPGCARNFLFPKKMAVYDSPINRIKFEEFTSSLKLEDKKDEEKRKAAIARLETVTVRLFELFCVVCFSCCCCCCFVVVCCCWLFVVFWLLLDLVGCCCSCCFILLFHLLFLFFRFV